MPFDYSKFEFREERNRNMFGKKEKIEVNDTNIFKMLLPSLIGIVVCILCLVGTTYAWFMSSIASKGINIQAADYEIYVEIRDYEHNLMIPNSGGDFILSPRTADNGYTVTITAKGTASMGYCLVNGKMATENLKPDESIQFTLYPQEDDELYTFVSYWGTYAGDVVIADGTTVGNPIILAGESSGITENITGGDSEEETEAPLEEETNEEPLLEMKENSDESDSEKGSSMIEENMTETEANETAISEANIQQMETE